MRLSFKNVLLFFSIILVALFLYGCKGEVYSGKLFSYPPNSQPHDNNREYLGKVIVTQKENTPFTRKAHKTIRINIEKDSNQKKYLSDKLIFFCADIDPVIEWDHFENLNITLFEVGNEFADDDYNRQLIKTGPQKLIHLFYVFDPKLNKFVRSQD